jgi:hypothetical protein
MRFKKSSVIATIVTAAVLGSATAAYAFVKLTGEGTGTGSKGVAAAKFKLDVELVSPVELVPGASAAVTVKVTNASTANGKVKLSNVVLSLPATAQGGCDAAALATLSFTSPGAVNEILATGASESFTGSVALADSDTVDQTCLLDHDLQVTANVS